MKMPKFHLQFAVCAAALLLPCSCEELMTSGRKGTLCVRFQESSAYPTKGADGLPDVNSFIMEVTGKDGESFYSGTFGNMPERLELPSGTYSVSARSCRFGGPVYDTPLFGDDQVVVVSGGAEASVVLSCTQLNSGLRLLLDYSFLSEFPRGYLDIKCPDGELMFDYAETRTAFFNPGSVSVVLKNQGADKLLFSRTLHAQQMLSVRLSAAAGAGASGGFDVAVDTTRNWSDEGLIVGGGGSTAESALSVPQARETGPKADVWVYGYIVGGDLTSSSCSFTPPFTSNTNFVLASKPSSTDRGMCLSVQLSKGDARDALNLHDHPEMLGRKVWLKGDIVEKYYGLPGLQNISEFKLE
ncbi:MAG: DUF4493 domain-containing protein [Bacteroidales bacterium]|nr:DUF4493 domain-containing protein [Bacteroidales bacterium]